MNTKLATALMVGVFVGFGMAFLIRLPDAKAQQEAAPPKVQPLQYEFKVTDFPRGSGDPEKKLTELAAERWEYVGVIFSGDHGSSSLIAFRRPKK